MEVALLIFLTIINALLAMSEMALASSRKARLQVLVESGHSAAKVAMELHDNPTQFLSTVQIGITLISVLNGIVGDAAFSQPLSEWLRHTLMLSERAAEVSATALVVFIITVFTLIFGELVPKRLGMMYPETVASVLAPAMHWLSRLTRPLVHMLSVSTQGILRLFGVRESNNRAVTEEEIAASLEEGLDAGIIEAHEHQMVRNVFRLDDRQIGSMMIPRGDIIWLNVEAPTADAVQLIADHGYSRYPVCRGSLDDVLGVITAQELLMQMTRQGQMVLDEGLQAPVFVPETLTGMELLEHFRASNVQMVFVVDEYGEVQGVITLRDVLETITGEFATTDEADLWTVQRADGSWLVDGLIPTPELKDRLGIRELPDEDRGRYNTLAGLLMLLLGRLPKTGDTTEWDGWRFEVLDLDGKRVDKVLAQRIDAEEASD